MGYPDTYYAATAVSSVPRLSLAQDVEVDVCVVGAGIAGLSCALELLQQGKSVVIVEREEVAWGASGRNGGLVSPGWAQSVSELQTKLGLAHAQALYKLSVQGAETIRSNIEKYHLDSCEVKPGQLCAARFPQRAALKKRAEQMERNHGIQYQFFDVEQVRNICDTKRYYEGLFNPNAFHFHPLNYCLGLAAQIEALGATIYVRSAVTHLIEQVDAVQVRCNDHTVTAKDVVFCGGGYTGPEIKALHRAYLPISTYVVLTEPLGDLATELISKPYSICDDRRAADYYRVVDGDRILWGSRITTKNEAQVDKLSAILREDMRSVYPVLGDVKVERAWSGLMSYAGHKMPIVRQQRPGVWLCSAFGGHGLNSGTAAAGAVARGICNIDEDYKLFEPFGCDWNGGILGPLAASIQYSYLRLKDRYQERV